VSIVVRPWQGEYGASLRAEEFVQFRQELQRLHEASTGEATFSPMEPWLELRLQRDSLGHIHLKGEAGPEGFGRNFGETRLVFEVRAFVDQTYLPPIIEQLMAVEEEFPVIGKPND
jgi:hypothetical protein